VRGATPGYVVGLLRSHRVARESVVDTRRARAC